jgi:SMODS and SLOG-associating 2TM effector domain 1
MRELRAGGYEARKQTYRQDRIANQRAWYGKEAGRNQRAALCWRLTSLGFQLAGVVAGVLRASGAVHVDLLGIAAAAAAAALAWLQTKDHATLADAYSITEQELGLADADLAGVDEADWPAAVDSAEQAISREHTLWRARRATLERGG